MNIPPSLHRQLILISGSSTQCLQSAHHFTTAVKTLWLSNEKVKGQTTIAISKATTVLGQEYQAVIFNAHTDKGVFDVNAFGAVVGTLMGGGTFILLTPTVSKWANHSFFLQRFIRLLKQFAIPLYTTQQPLIPAAVVNLAPSTHHDSHEQQDAFNAMVRVIQGHRRRPFVLTSDRGRGKSTLLGKFAAYLLHQGKRHIIVTAPSKKIAEPLFNAARTELEVLKSSASAMKGLHFLSPDALHQQKPTADIVLVDEAASIPLPLLADFVKQHSRLIFATTEHGYEGCGRGFAIRFRSLLTRLTPHWKSAHLEHPFRWQKNDPLEKFSFDALLLNADIATLDDTALTNLSPTDCELSSIRQDELLANETLLREIVGLLVSAHYQTKPSDLVRLLDDKNYLIFTMRYKKHLVATALIVKEGGFSTTLADAIYAGQRRPQGHLIPQLLATHTGIKEAPCYHCHRIMRIAVHPTLQGQGIGSHLLDYLVKSCQQEQSVDYIATSFGATTSLISFWRKAGFKSVQIGMKRDASSGRHSLVMLYPITENAHQLKNNATNHFKQALPLLLADPLRDLDPPLISVLLEPSAQCTTLLLNNAEQDKVRGFAEQQRGYENSIVVIYKLTVHLLSQPPSQHQPNLTQQEQHILIAKVLQKQPWHHLVKQSQVNSKKQALTYLRNAVKKLAYLY